MNSVTWRQLIIVPALLAAAPYHPASMASVDPDGIRSLLSNPAGLGLLDGKETALQLGGNQIGGQDAILIGLPHFGIGWERHNSQLLPVKESNLLVGVGSTLGSVSAGFTGVRHVLDGYVQGWSADFGMLWRPIPQFSAAWTIPDFLARDASRDKSNTVGIALRPLGTSNFTVSAEAQLPTTPWNRSAWDAPTWELGVKLRPLSWLGVEARMDPKHLRQMGFGVQIQANPNLDFYSTATPTPSGSEFQTAGVRFASRSRPAAKIGDGTLIYRLANTGSESPSGDFWRQTAGFWQIRDDFREMFTIRDLKTVVLDLGSSRFSPVQAGILRRMILDLRASGREVYAWSNDLDMANLYILSAANKAAISPEGVVRTRGLSMDVLYFGELFKRRGVNVQVVKTGPWKAAMEPYEQASISEPARQNLARILFDLDSLIMGGVAQERKLDPTRLVAFVDTGSALPRAAVAAGLIDTLLEHDGLAKWTKGRKMSLPLTGIHDPNWGGSPRVAVVVLEGQIIDRPGETGMIPWNPSLVAESVAPQLEALAKNPRVGAVVLRIQSPGGSVAGSERLRRAVAVLAKAKPVVASFGSTAASGGYMIALPAATIFSEPEAMVGSIGVFAAKVSVGGLLDSFGIHAQRIRTAPHAGALSNYFPLDSVETVRMTEFVEDAHAKFRSEVMEARHLDTAAFRQVDGGRVFSGVRAQQLALVDSIGGLDAAVAWSAAKAGIAPDRSPLWFDAKSSDWLTQGATTGWLQTQSSSPMLLGQIHNFLETPRAVLWSQSAWEPQWP